MLLQGLFIPLTCPFYRDGASYLRKLEHNVRRYSLSPAAGLVALAPALEADAVTDAEAQEVFTAVADTAAPHKVLLAGVQRSSVRAALALCEQAAKARFDAVLLSAPRDWARLVHGPDASEVLLYFKAVADHAPLPVVLWSEAAVPGLPLPVEIVGELARHRNVIGLIDADLDVARLQALQQGTAGVQREATVTTIFEAVTQRMLQPVAEEGAGQAAGAFVGVEALSAGGGTSTALLPPAAPAIKTRSRTVGFQVLAGGATADSLPLLQSGAGGLMPASAACAPQACFEAYAAWKDGDHALAGERGERLRAVEKLIRQHGVATIKAGCDFNGYFGGVPRLPRLPLTAEGRATLEAALRYIRN